MCCGMYAVPIGGVADFGDGCLLSGVVRDGNAGGSPPIDRFMLSKRAQKQLAHFESKEKSQKLVEGAILLIKVPASLCIPG